MTFAKFKIGVRLGVGFAVVLILLTVISGLGMWRLKTVGDLTEQIVTQAAAKERLITEWKYASQINGVRTIASANSTDEQEQKRLSEKIKATSQRISELQAQWEGMRKDAAEDAMDDDVAAKRKAYIDARNTVFKAKEEGAGEQARTLSQSLLQPALETYLASLHALSQHQSKRMTTLSEEVKSQYQLGELLIMLLGAAALLAGIGFAYWIARSITRPLAQAVKVAQTVAAGDLTSRIEVGSADETGQLLQALREMNDSLVRIVGEVRNGTDTIATASGQIASGNLDLSSRTEQQAGSLEETASSMEELTGTVKQNADNARQANQLAVSASDVALKGGAVVSQVVDTMGSINDSAKKIADIIGVIDGIAFQTNILALNAAVEAARAGEQGRGFAVVAGEVRNLAQRSAAAAKEIKTLISDSVEKVDAGTRLVDQAGATMDEIVESVKRVSDIISEITAASQEQTSGIEQINQAIAQMDEVTQQNASLVEEAAAAAESLQDQASSLAQVVSVFKLDGMVDAAVIPLRTARAATAHPGSTAAGNHGRPALRAKQPRRLEEARASANSEWEEF